ncbi:cyclic lactone autoinducer peptide [Clostridium weizhouense]|uniref:Cyclic lactone autoinducer peptide n=1 Tax=Clostridium weizhouense TaxID=2859781 RepID=A0ABS7AQ05_9CLOT|nr:cyclic lactone autoinducer peptide [Clostridium weizhouense]MBW6410755.1 cyclic lactone autoinducer peptide [Clostridium weizhouense]
MQRSARVFSTVLIRLFDLISNTSCLGLFGEPDYPEELK